MQVTKRLAFLLVLFAFLGNLALGIGLPVYKKQSLGTFKENNKQLHFNNKVKSSAYFLTLEETEEIEESEADSDFDSTPNLQHYHSAYLTQLFVQFNAAPQLANKPGIFRTWLWVKHAIFIYYQVFRI